MAKNEILVNGEEDNRILERFGIKIGEPREGLRIFQEPDIDVPIRRGKQRKTIPGKVRIIARMLK